MTCVQDSLVAIATGEAVYPRAPFSPGEAYPEYRFGDVSGEPNAAYAGVRSTLRLLGLDAAGYGTSEWNPLGEIVRPGETVVLKPNFVRDFRETQPGDGDCTITHGSVLRAVADYVQIALGGRGRLIIADAPQNDGDFENIRRIVGLDALQAFYAGRAGAVPLEVYDLRPECAEKIDGVIVGHRRLSGDPAGYVRVNLGLDSAFAEINELCHLLYGSEYDTNELLQHQHDDVHEYLISRTILEADVVISVPKLKTHKKVGLTVNLKNLVGINGNKNWLPHHREGTPSQGGDQFADDLARRRIERSAQFKRIFPRLGPLRPLVAGPIKAFGRRVFGDTNTDTIRSGNWYGNDTTWRMVLDLNRVLLYADPDGELRAEPARRVMSIVDGIVAGEGNGPLDASPKAAGVVLAGGNPVAVDLACARLMGFDPDRLPMLRHAFEAHRWPLTGFAAGAVCARSDDPRFAGPVAGFDPEGLGFVPHFGWRGHIEMRPSRVESA
jgi:uncharacterized protein (DUF362 family)